MKRVAEVILILLMGLSFVFSQSGGRVFKVTSFVGMCEYRLPEGEWKQLNVGDEIGEEMEIRVNGIDDYLELVLENTTTIRLSGMTSLLVKEVLREDFSKKKNSVLYLLTGKLLVKAKLLKDRMFKVETETSVAAVRGTKFGISYTFGEGGELVVSEGAVEVMSPSGSFESVVVKAGEMFRLPSMPGEKVSKPMKANEELIKQYDIDTIRGTPPEEAMPEEKETKTLEEKPSPSRSSPFSPPSIFKPDLIGGSIFNFSLGSQNISGDSCYKFIFSPVLSIGPFSFGLYLPVFLKSSENVFSNTQTLYNIKDWDFSSPEDSWHDVLTKIYFIEFRTSSILLRLGTLDNYTLGSGILVNNYNNNLFFPSERNVGFIFGLDSGVAGTEFFVGNAGNFELFGGRAFVRPLQKIPIIDKWSIGLSSFVDLKPLSNLNDRVFGYSIDMDMPFINSGILGLGIYAGAGGIGYYDSSTNSLKYLTGLGMNAGFRGNILMISFKAEYKNAFGGFSPGYVDYYYDVTREAKFLKISCSELSFTNNVQNGFFAEIGMDITNIIKAGISYEHMFPFGVTQASYVDNKLHAEIKLYKGIIKKLYGTIYYDWPNVTLESLANRFPAEGSIFTAEIFYEVAFGIYIGLEYKTFFEKNDGGEIENRSLYGFRMEISF